MKKLFNEYCSYNKDGMDLSDKTCNALKSLFKEIKENDLNLIEAEHIMISEIEYLFALYRMERAVKIRKDKESEKVHTDKRQDT